MSWVNWRVIFSAEWKREQVVSREENIVSAQESEEVRVAENIKKIWNENAIKEGRGVKHSERSMTWFFDCSLESQAAAGLISCKV